MKTLTKGQYYGVKDSQKSYEGIVLSKYNYVGEKTDWHYHENPYFMYVLHGNMKDINAKVGTLCPPGSLMFNNWQEKHFGSKHSHSASGFHLEFEKNWLASHNIPPEILEGSHQIKNPKVHFLFAKLYQELLVLDGYSQISVELLVVQICDVLTELKYKRDSHHMPPWISRLIEIIHSDQENLSLEFLSKQLDVHPTHISRTLPKYLSMSLGEYIRYEKLKNAIPLLLDTNLSLTSIAYKAGFADMSHFNKVFNAVFNQNPSAYRKKLSKK